jgi:hypothetical protein
MSELVQHTVWLMKLSLSLGIMENSTGLRIIANKRIAIQWCSDCRFAGVAITIPADDNAEQYDFALR